MVVLDVSVVNVALPSIRSDLGFSAVALTAGFHRAFVVGACFGAAGAITVAVLLLRVRPPRRPTPEAGPVRIDA